MTFLCWFSVAISDARAVFGIASGLLCCLKSLYNRRANVPNCSHVPHPKTVLKMNPKDISCFLLFQKCVDKIKHLLESHALFPTAFPDQGPQTRKHRPRLQEDSPPLWHQQTLRIVRSVFLYTLVMILSFFVAGLCHFLSFIFFAISCFVMFIFWLPHFVDKPVSKGKDKRTLGK